MADHGGDGGGGRHVLRARRKARLAKLAIWLLLTALGWAAIWLVWHVLIPAVTR